MDEPEESAPATMAQGEAGVDEETLAQLLTLGDQNPEGLIEACNLFLGTAVTRLAEVDDALVAGRLDEAGRLAHGLHGSSGSFGARRLSQLAGQLENACQRGDAGSAGSLVAPMRTEFIAFRAVITERLTSLWVDPR